MNRLFIATILGSAAAISILIAWNTVKEDREYRRLLSIGDITLASNQTFEAIEAFSGAVAIRPDSTIAYLKRGNAYKHRGELTAALRDLEEAVTLNPSSTEALELLGDLNVETGNQKQAIKHYLAFTRVDNQSIRALHKLATSYYWIGEIEKSIDATRQVIKINENLADAHHLLGLCLRELGQIKEAELSFKRALEIDPLKISTTNELTSLLNMASNIQEQPPTISK